MAKQPGDLVTFAGFAIREGSVADAQRVLELLTQQGRHDDRHQALQMRLFALAHPEQALELAARQEKTLKGDDRLLFLRFLAVALSREGRTDLAMKIVNSYFRFNSQSVIQLECLAYAKDPKEIEAVVKRLGDKFPPESALGVLINWSLRQQSVALAKSIEARLKALGTAGDPRLLSAIAAWYELQGDTTRSMKYTRLALTAAPDDYIHRNNLIWGLAVYERKPQEALKLVNQLLKEAGPSAQLLDTKGVTLYQLGRYQEASFCLRAAWDGGDGATQLHLAAAFQKLERRKLASQLFAAYRKRQKPGNPFDEGLVNRLADVASGGTSETATISEKSRFFPTKSLNRSSILANLGSTAFPY